MCLCGEAETLRHGPVALDAGTRAEPLLLPKAALCKAQLARHRQLPLVRRQQVLLPRSRCPPAQQRVLRPTSPPRWWSWPQLFDTAVHGADELADTLSPIATTGGPPNTTCADTWPWEQKTCRLCTRRHSRLASSASRAHCRAPAPTTNAVSVACMTKKLVVKQCKSTMIGQLERKQLRHQCSRETNNYVTKAQEKQAITSPRLKRNKRPKNADSNERFTATTRTKKLCKARRN